MDDVWGMTVKITHEAWMDRPMVRRAISLLFAPGDWHELRALPSGKSRVVQSDGLDAAFAAVQSLADQQVYYSVNPILPGSERASKQTVAARRWFAIDIDAVRPKDASSTEEEKVKAASVAGAVLDYLLDQGWPAPLMIDSGNGWHLLYRIDLPNDSLTKEIIKRCVYALGERFTTEDVVIDRVTHDAARIFKLPGTMARKGPDTPDRPHRPCRIAYEPDKLEIVPVELLQKLGSPPAEKPASTNGKHDPWEMKVQAEPGLASYLKRAIESECFRVALAVNLRNDQLNKSAFALGQFAAWPEIDEHETKAKLQLAAERAGLLDREIIKTITSGWEAGTLQPRPRPQEPVKATSKATPATGKRIIWASTVKPRKVEWLCPGRIPLGKMTTFAGQTGLGKTFTICDLAARVTTGREIPFGKGECYQRGKVLIISAEDDADDTIVPRFMTLGGDLSRLALLSPESEEQFSLAALELLNGCLDDMGPDVRMVAIDPPTSYLGKVDDHRNAELRGLLAPLRNWARDRNIALVFVTHVNKPGAQKLEAMSRVMGSVAWVAAVRSAHMFCPDPQMPSRSLYLPLKVNNAAKRKGMAYEIVTTVGDMATLKWLEEVDVTADDAMNPTMPRKSAGQSAVEWLMDRFREKPEWRSADLKDLSRDAGLTFNQVFKSPEVNALPIDKRPRSDPNGEQFWVWRARKGWPLPKGPQKPGETPEIPESVNVSSFEKPAY